MKVLLVHTFHHDRGGDSTYVRTVERELQARGHSVVHLAMRHPDNDPSIFEASFVPWNEGRRPWPATVRDAIWSPWAERSALELAARERPDVAHVHHVHRHLTPSVLSALRFAGVPIVWTAHDYELVCPAGTLFTEGQHCERCRGHRYHEAVLHRCKHGSVLRSGAAALEKTMHALRGVPALADRIVCPSQYLLEAFVRFGLPRERLKHLPNPVALPEDRRDSSPSGRRGWCFTGRLAEEKGVRILLEAAALLGDIPGTIVGTGPLAAEVQSFAAGRPNLRITGRLTRVDAQRVVVDSDIVVVPSLWAENQPYGVLEAQAAGRPVVASAVGGIPELIDDGEDGLLVTAGDARALAAAIRRTHDDPAEGERLGRAGRARASERHGVGPHVNALLQLYAEVGGGSGR